MRTELREHTLYKFNELSDKAKEHAIQTYWASDVHTDFVYDDAVRMGELMGIEIATRNWTNTHGFKGSTPTIYYSGFWSQGDGACFEGYYHYKKGAVAAIKEETGFGYKCPDGTLGKGDDTLIRIAQGLQDAQRPHFYRLVATCKHRGHYYHSGCMDVEVEDSEDPYRDIGDADDEITSLLREFADWIYKRLEEDYEWQTSEECVAESCEANGYEFDEKGNMQ